MATSTLIQFIEPGEGAATSNRRQVETFIATAPIAIGDWVSLATAKTGADKALYVDKSVGIVGSGLLCGVAISAAAADEKVDVVIGGYCAVANIAGAVAIGEALRASGTIGAADAITAGAEAVIGVALTALGAPGTAEVWVYNRF